MKSERQEDDVKRREITRSVAELLSQKCHDAGIAYVLIFSFESGYTGVASNVESPKDIQDLLLTAAANAPTGPTGTSN